MANETMWSQGPWRAGSEVNDSRDAGRWGIQNNDFFIATTCADVEFNEERSQLREEFNARLIAAAPDLYSALEELVAVSWEDIGADDGSESPVMYRARLALAKARGES